MKTFYYAKKKHKIGDLENFVSEINHEAPNKEQEGDRATLFGIRYVSRWMSTQRDREGKEKINISAPKLT